MAFCHSHETLDGPKLHKHSINRIFTNNLHDSTINKRFIHTIPTSKTWEIIWYVELLRRGYDVRVGCYRDSEVDFLAVRYDTMVCGKG